MMDSNKRFSQNRDFPRRPDRQDHQSPRHGSPGRPDHHHTQGSRDGFVPGESREGRPGRFAGGDHGRNNGEGQVHDMGVGHSHRGGRPDQNGRGGNGRYGQERGAERRGEGQAEHHRGGEGQDTPRREPSKQRGDRDRQAQGFRSHGQYRPERPAQGFEGRSHGQGSGPVPSELEERLHDWLDILVWVWRRRTQGADARFAPKARLGDTELHTLAQGVKTLSKGLTGERGLASTAYMQDPDLLGAYLLFYWPLSWAQAWTVLHDPGCRRQGFRLQGGAIDLGSGPGPAAFAMLDTGAEACLALDSSPLALDLAEELAKARRLEPRRLETRLWKAGQSLESLVQGAGTAGVSWNTACYGHLLNELPGLDSRLNLIQSVNQVIGARGTHIAFEPALKTTTRQLLEFRDALLAGENTPRVLGPCFIQKACPVLETPDQTCHGAVHWQVPGLIQRLAHAARLGKEELAMSWLVWQNPGGAEAQVATDSDLYRVTGEAMLNKAGFTRLMVCGGQGGAHEGRMTLRMKREDLNGGEGIRKAGRAFFALKRSDVIRLGDPVARESGLGVDENTKLERLD